MRPAAPPDERRPNAVGTVAAAALVVGPVVLAFFSGGYFDGPRLAALIGVAVVLALVALAQPPPVLPAGVGARAALGGIVLLAGWVALSRGRSSLPDVAGDDAERVALYAAFLAAGSFAWRSRTAARLAEPAIAAGIVAVIGYGLAGRWLPGLIDLTATRSAGGRLEQPLTYWNATGMLAALGAVLCVRMAGDRGRPPRVAAAAAAAAVPLLCGVYLSFSRGAAGALVAGVLVLVLCAPDRGQIRAIVTALGTGAVAVVASALLPGVRALEGTPAARERDGLVALAVTLAAMAAAALLSARTARAAVDGGLRTGVVRLPRGTRWVVAVVIVLAVVGPVLVSHNEGATRQQAGFGASTQRFTSVSSNRYDYWRVALRSFGRHPLAGVGSGGWAVDWLRERPFAEAARDAHSIELETLAELGLVGFALVLVTFGGVARCAVVVQRRDPQLAAGACAGLAVWAAHSALDWDWEMPGATLPALTLAGVLIARSEAGPAAAAATSQRVRAGVPGRVAVVAAAVAIAAVGLVARQGDDRCSTAQKRAEALQASAAGTDPRGVVREIVDSCQATPKALSALASVVAAGHRPEAVEGVRALTRRHPEDYVPWVALGALEPDPARARAAKERAHVLNPRGVRAPA